MNSRIRISKVISYTTTDGEVFSGRRSKIMAEKHQWSLDKKDLLDKFDVFMREIFGIKCKHVFDEHSDEESEFCENIMKEVTVYAEDGDFKGEISSFVLDLFGFIGQVRWQQIHDFLTKNV